jgi:hypothetical protein
MNGTMEQTTGQHPGQGDLVRLLDGELDELTERRLRDHVDGCARCMGRLRTLEKRSTAFSHMVARLDDGAGQRDELAPRRAASAGSGHRAMVWRAAAVIMVGLFGAMSVPQLRAWVADQWSGLGWLGEPAATAVEDERTLAETPAAPPADERPTERHAVSFVPEGREFLVEVRATQAGGVLTLTMRPGREASAVVEGRGPEADLVVLPYGVRIENVAAATLDYQVEVPSDLDRVRVRIGNRPDVLLPVSEVGREWTLRYDLTD